MFAALLQTREEEVKTPHSHSFAHKADATRELQNEDLCEGMIRSHPRAAVFG